MSVAIEFPPDVHVPGRARPERDATVLVFRPRLLAAAPVPSTQPPAALRDAARATSRLYPVRAAQASTHAPPGDAPLRLTRRGYAVAGLLAVVLVAGLLWLAHASAPASPHTPEVSAVTVRNGDTLWSIAARIAPQRDPRRVVAELEDANNLSSPVVEPGQILRTR